MRVTNVSVTTKATIPTQAYGSFSIDVSWHAELDEGETPEQVTQDLYRRIIGEVSDAVRPIAKEKGKQLMPYLNRLPKEDQKQVIEMMGPVRFLRLVSPVIADRYETILEIEAGETPPPADNGAGALDSLKTAVAEETDNESEKEE